MRNFMLTAALLTFTGSAMAQVVLEKQQEINREIITEAVTRRLTGENGKGIEKTVVSAPVTYTYTEKAIPSGEASQGNNPTLYVNKDITTVIVFPENIKIVDISTKRVIGNKVADNILRLKPAEQSEFTDSVGEKKWKHAEKLHSGDNVGIVTIIGERHIAQYDIVYTEKPLKAHSLYNVPYGEMNNYTNKDVLMTKGEMSRYAWNIWKTKKKYYKINVDAYGMHAQINNIYTLDDYFFIDFSLYNKTNIKYDINEIRIKLTDKRQTKATNNQTVELSPEFELNTENSFKRHYRNIIVIKKLTFPEEKILKLEISEDQISGRVISIPIEYSDILKADNFDRIMMKD